MLRPRRINIRGADRFAGDGRLASHKMEAGRLTPAVRVYGTALSSDGAVQVVGTRDDFVNAYDPERHSALDLQGDQYRLERRDIRRGFAHSRRQRRPSRLSAGCDWRRNSGISARRVSGVMWRFQPTVRVSRRLMKTAISICSTARPGMFSGRKHLRDVADTVAIYSADPVFVLVGFARFLPDFVYRCW